MVGPILDGRFTPSWWLRGAHAQTLWGNVARSRRLVSYRRELIVTPDDDDLYLDHLDVVDNDAPHIVLLHGLEGSSYSVYIQGLASLARERGWHVTALNFRACARDPQSMRQWIPNRGRRLYHSGETTDFDFVLRLLQERYPRRKFAAVGVSLGGNVLMKWLGEDESRRLVAGAALSVPFDLAAGARYLETGAGPVYVWRFLRSLRIKLKMLLDRHPDLRTTVDLERAERANSFYDYDDAATAPLHGFAGAEDYWARCSSIFVLDRIKTPSMAIVASDDPFVPPDVVERAAAVASEHLRVEPTPSGGHVGFVSGPSPFSCRYWAEEAAIEFIAKAMSNEQ